MFCPVCGDELFTEQDIAVHKQNCAEICPEDDWECDHEWLPLLEDNSQCVCLKCHIVREFEPYDKP
jgi:hypothetical protein